MDQRIIDAAIRPSVNQTEAHTSSCMH